MTQLRMGPAVGGVGNPAVVAPAPVLVPALGAVSVLAATRPTRKVRASVGAVPLPVPVFPQREERLAALGAGPRVRRLATVSGAILPIGVAATAGGHQVVRDVVGGVAVQVVGADGDPSQGRSAPVADERTLADLVVKDDPTNCHLSIPAGERVVGQVPTWPSDSHSHHSSTPWRTTDPGQRAKAMRVDKPPAQLAGQTDLLAEIGGVA